MRSAINCQSFALFFVGIVRRLNGSFRFAFELYKFLVNKNSESHWIQLILDPTSNNNVSTMKFRILKCDRLFTSCVWHVRKALIILCASEMQTHPFTCKSYAPIRIYLLSTISGDASPDILYVHESIIASRTKVKGYLDIILKRHYSFRLASSAVIHSSEHWSSQYSAWNLIDWMNRAPSQSVCTHTHTRASCFRASQFPSITFVLKYTRYSDDDNKFLVYTAHCDYDISFVSHGSELNDSSSDDTRVSSAILSVSIGHYMTPIRSSFVPVWRHDIIIKLFHGSTRSSHTTYSFAPAQQNDKSIATMLW